MDQHAQRLVFAVDELWTALAELRSSLIVIAAHDAGTPSAYRDAITSVEQARRLLVDATHVLLAVEGL